jgi:inner membrane protein
MDGQTGRRAQAWQRGSDDQPHARNLTPMTGRTHAIGGIASLALLRAAGLLGGGTGDSGVSLALPLVLAVVGSLLPDLDAEHAALSEWGWTGSLGKLRPFRPLADVASHLPHRGPTHSAWALWVVAAGVSPPLAALVGWPTALALPCGYASHVLLDMCTVSGVPVLWPDRRRFWLLPPRLRVTTGTLPEDLFWALPLAAMAALVSPAVTVLVLIAREGWRYWQRDLRQRRRRPRH